MKKYIIILSTLFLSCNNEDSCDKQLSDAYEQYKTSLNNCGTSYSAMQSVTSQYNSKKQSILNNCK
jgi:flagellar capping protein FliD